MAEPQFLICAYAPNSELALENSVHVNPIDARTPYVGIGNFIYRSVPHPDVEPGHIGMNAIQRRMARTFAGNSVQVFEFLVPVNRDFTISAVTIEAQFVKPMERTFDLTHLANAVRTSLTGDVLTFGQSIVIQYQESNILLWIKSDVRGLVTAQTEVGITWIDDNK
jgi:hypothetical protein